MGERTNRRDESSRQTEVSQLQSTIAGYKNILRFQIPSNSRLLRLAKVNAIAYVHRVCYLCITPLMWQYSSPLIIW